MTDPAPDTSATIPDETTPAAPTAEGASEAATETAPPPDPLALLQAEADRWKDLAYRSQAELDNFRKRAAREAQEARAYANADLLRSILPILDNFEMGLDAARAESEKSMIYMGMSMVQRQIQDFLRENGLQEIDAAGKPFDPNLHEAVSQEATDTCAEGTVLRVTRRGYRLKDRLLRASSVIVSTTPATAQEQQAATANA